MYDSHTRSLQSNLDKDKVEDHAIIFLFYNTHFMLRPWQNGRHFDDMLKYILLNKVCVLIKFSLKLMVGTETMKVGDFWRQTALAGHSEPITSISATSELYTHACWWYLKYFFKWSRLQQHFTDSNDSIIVYSMKYTWMTISMA